MKELSWSADRQARAFNKHQSISKEMNTMSCYSLQLTPRTLVTTCGRIGPASLEKVSPNTFAMTRGMFLVNPTTVGSTTTPTGPFGAVLHDFQSIVNQPLQPPDWVIESLIVQGERTVIYGEYGSLKSWILLDMAMHIAAGQDWLGHFKIPKPRKVLYIDEEMAKSTLDRRVQRLALGSSLNTLPLEFKVFSNIGVSFDSNAAQKLLAELAFHRFDPDVIIIETLRGVLVGSENEARDVNAFWKYVKPLCRAGKAIIIAHHMKKPHVQFKQAARNLFSGHTSIISNTDAAFSITRVPGKQGHVSIRGEKSRDTTEVGDFEVRLDADPTNLAGSARIDLVSPPPPLGSLATGAGTQVGSQVTAQQAPSKTALAKDFIEDELATATNRTLPPKEIKRLAAAAGHSERTVERALKEMLGNKVRKTDAGDYELL
jgi:hypothetical protein